VVALGGDTPTAWATARKLNRELAGLDPDAPEPGSVSWLFAEFSRHEKFAALGASTQGDYKWIARRLGAVQIGAQAFGRYPARAVKARHADRIYALVRDESGPAAAHYVCRVARRVWNWAGRLEHVDRADNPWAKMELKSLPQRTAVWTPEQVAACVAAAAQAGWPSIGLAVQLAY